MVNLGTEDEGRPLNFEESKKHQDAYKKNAVIQFLNLYKKSQNYTLSDQLNENQHPMSILWGDEIESQVIKLDPQSQKVTMVTDNENFFTKFDQDQQRYPFSLQAEYGSYQIETTPKLPYTTVTDLSEVLINIKQRNHTLEQYLKKDEKIINIPIFPLCGKEDLSYFEKNGEEKFINRITQSQFIDDRLINNHPFFHQVTSNGIQRIGGVPKVKIPIYKDINTKFEPTLSEPYPGYIYLDSAVYGAACCLQATFTAKNHSQSRRLYDQLSILGPLFLSMTAATPIHKGFLAETDTKWQVLSQTFDYRTEDELDPQSKNYTPKSRWEQISYYISDEKRNLDIYSDSKSHPLNVEIMSFAKKQAEKLGLTLDEKLIKFLGFLFYKDALAMFTNTINTDNESDTTHFNHMQAIGLHSVRLRPPPSFDSKIGWRMEFRTGDIQLTNEENAAFVMLIFIIGRLFYESDEINFYMPMSLVEENYQRSQQMNSVLTQKYFFRTNIFDQGEPITEELTINEIFFGKEGTFEGLHKVSLKIWKQIEVKAHGSDNMDQNTYFHKTFKFIKEKTTGERLTIASWIRQFVLNHPNYKKDSKVSDQIAYELLSRAVKISSGEVIDKNFSNIF